MWALVGMLACDGEDGDDSDTGAQSTSTGSSPGSTSDAPGSTSDDPQTTGGGGTTTTTSSDDTTSGGSTGGGGETDTGTGDEPTTGGVQEGIFEEIDGIVAVEAEHAFEIDDNSTERTWYIFASGDEPNVKPDPDPPHWDSASGSSCLEGLPDTRVTHDDQLQGGVNFYGSGGDGPILRYRVWINNPGRYWVRVRAYSTGTEDNGIHVGLDGDWPASGERIQWCQGKNQWTWSGAQRTQANHCGEANQIFLDIDTPGEHVINFSMREDGFEMDKWMLTDDPDVFPEDEGPAETPYTG